jgi:Peptidase family M1 domain
VTKVLVRSAQMIAVAGCLLATALAQPSCPQTPDDLYSRLRTISLDPSRIYHIRDAAIDRPHLSLTFDRGTLAFTEDICGRITGAFFAGDGEVLLQPPNRVERSSLSLFTGMAILEDQFTAAYLRFNDDTAQRLQPFLSPATNTDGFLSQWGDMARGLADYDALRLLLDFSHFLPSRSTREPQRKFPPTLHAHLLSERLGGYEVFWDGSNTEPLWAGQARQAEGHEFLDIWTSFSVPALAGTAPQPRISDAATTSYHIRATVHPPTLLQASTDVDVRVRNGGPRILLFELSRYLKVDRVELADGRPLAFIQNPAIQGTQLQRKGNDLVAVVFPADLETGQELKLHFSYAGEVLSDAGNGLLYVGARGSWYPSFGLSPASFDMEFHYPEEWTLLATGKQVHPATRQVQPDAPNDRVSRWISDRPIPIAGFNLGKYVRAEAKAGTVLVEAYSTKGVERAFPKAPAEVIESPGVPGHTHLRSAPPVVVVPPPPSLVRDVQPVADKAALAVTTFSQWFGPYPYTSLALTQMPGDLSQGWPGLVFLSSYAFLSPQEELDLHLDTVTRIENSQVLVHETAHQWWGDLVLWKSYRDEWLTEGLANYSSMLVVDGDNPGHFHLVMEKYREDLLRRNKNGDQLRDAGPVTLGPRLISSRFPDGYEAIAYERGTWLFHMLRCMLRDTETPSHPRTPRVESDELFFRALRKAVERYAGKSMSTGDLMQIFEEELPRPLWYENRHKLDWFVEGWINGTAIPELSTREIRIADKTGSTKVSGVVVQKDAPDDLVTAVPVYAETSAHSLVFLGEVLADGHETPFQFAAPANVRKVLLDPKQTILAVVK